MYFCCVKIKIPNEMTHFYAHVKSPQGQKEPPNSWNMETDIGNIFYTQGLPASQTSPFVVPSTL